MQKTRKIILITVSALLTTGILFLLILLLLVRTGAYGPIPSKKELRNIQNPLATEVFSADSVLMGKYFIQDRNDIDSAELKPEIKQALIATEDARFYKHKGIDTRSLLRVLVKTLLLQDRSAGGGSTISQQLAKNLYPRDKKGFLSLSASKIREMIIARKLEKIYPKDEIILLYLNTVPFGENSFGIKSSSRRFFNKDPQELRLEEAAVLIGMLKATTSYNPRNNPEAARRRRNVVLSQMVQYDYLDEETADSLSNLEISLDYNPLTHYSGIAPYFREFLRREIMERLEQNPKENGENYNIYTDGLRVYTTIDSRLQKYAEKSVRKHMSRLQEDFNRHWAKRDLWAGKDKTLESFMLRANGNDGQKMQALLAAPARERLVFTYKGDSLMNLTWLDSLKHQLNFLQAGMLVMENRNARVRAWIGGIDHQFFKYDHVLSRRQAGSVFKPIVYLAALEKGMKPCDLVKNDSIVYEEYEDWQPRNADREYGGLYSMQGGLTHSINTVSVSILLETGIPEVMETAVRAGIRPDLPAVPSLALGTAEISLLELVNAYQGIANRGIRHVPEFITRIEDKNGNILFLEEENREGVHMTDPSSAELLTGMLKNAIEYGTGMGLKTWFDIPGDIAGKTGTTQNHSDGWFIGFTPEYTAGVWVGGELPHIAFRTLDYGQGAYSALPIWAYFFREMYKDPEFSRFRSREFILSEETREMLDCDDFYERKPFRIFGKDIEKFIRDLFRGKGDRD
jgi:penicillin-binding protein 1A